MTQSTAEDLSAEMARMYGEGKSIRAIAAAIGKSYGFVNRHLREAGVTLRPRGGARKKSTPESS